MCLFSRRARFATVSKTSNDRALMTMTGTYLCTLQSPWPCRAGHGLHARQRVLSQRRSSVLRCHGAAIVPGRKEALHNRRLEKGPFIFGHSPAVVRARSFLAKSIHKFCFRQACRDHLATSLHQAKASKTLSFAPAACCFRTMRWAESFDRSISTERTAACRCRTFC